MSLELKALEALKEQGPLDTYATGVATGDDGHAQGDGPDIGRWAIRLCVMEGLGLVERVEEETQYGNTEWAILPLGLWLLKEEE